MSYCDIADVEGLNAQRNKANSGAYGSSTMPTATQVQGFIDQIAGEIDSVLAALYVLTPVTVNTDFLKRLNAMGAASLAEAAQFPEFDATTPGMTPQSQRYYRWYEDALKSLKDRSALDPAWPLAGNDSLASNYLTDNPDNEPFNDGMTGERPGDGQQPYFMISKVF